MPKVSAQPGVKGVQRVVCGGCHDFKVVTSMPADKFGAWEEKKFEPEEEFLEAIKAIPGVATVETQTYTLMPMKVEPPPILKKPKVWQIGRLNPDSKSFNLEAKVMSEPTEVEGKGASKIFELVIGDKTGKITCSLKEAQADMMKSLPASKVCMFRNARVIMVKGHMRLVVDKWGKIDYCPETEIETVGDKDVSTTEFELVQS